MDKSKRTLSISCPGIGLALLLAVALDFAAAAPLCATEAASPAYETISGDYVWYEDFTFKRASYVGFLYYDEGTLAMRYYAPADAEQGLGEKSIDIYVTHDGTVLTGERVIGGDGEDNIAVVNYLHDLFYDLGGVSSGVLRSIYVGETPNPCGDPTPLTAFGGDAVVEMDDGVPIYGVRRILGNDNKVLSQVITVGHLTASDDQSFTAFKGDPATARGRAAGTPAKGKRANKVKKGKSVKYQAGAVSFALDSNWKQNMANMWMLGSDAVVSIAQVPSTADAAPLVRRLTRSSGDGYIDWRTLQIERNGERTTIECTTLGTPSMRTWRVLAGGCLFSLTVKDAVYQANRSYFEGIVKSLQSA